MILELLKKVTKSLEDQEIPYMLSGSMAMNVYTVPRMTRDIDIVVNLKISDFNKFVSIFEQGFYIYKEGISEEIKRRGMFNVIDLESGQKIDFIVRKNTAFHLNEFERRQRIEAYGFPLWIVSLEDLIIAKLKWIQDFQSETQMRDIENLLTDNKVDRNYLLKWIENMNLKTFDLI